MHFVLSCCRRNLASPWRFEIVAALIYNINTTLLAVRTLHVLCEAYLALAGPSNLQLRHWTLDFRIRTFGVVNLMPPKPNGRRTGGGNDEVPKVAVHLNKSAHRGTILVHGNQTAKVAQLGKLKVVLWESVE